MYLYTSKVQSIHADWRHTNSNPALRLAHAPHHSNCHQCHREVRFWQWQRNSKTFFNGGGVLIFAFQLVWCCAKMWVFFKKLTPNIRDFPATNHDRENWRVSIHFKVDIVVGKAVGATPFFSGLVGLAQTKVTGKVHLPFAFEVDRGSFSMNETRPAFIVVASKSKARFFIENFWKVLNPPKLGWDGLVWFVSVP